MEQYRFTEEVNQRIVDGILQGYKNYLHERNDKFESMYISDAYAWVKGNHIDDQTARECQSVGIVFRKAKAGYTWGYLQFSSEEDKSMFIVKNAKYFNPDNVPGGRGVTGKKRRNTDDNNYLKVLSKVNVNVAFPSEDTIFSDDLESEQILSIFDDNVLRSLEKTEATALQAKFNKFYIVTYMIDEAHMISNIDLWLPNPATDKAHKVDDLSRFIVSSSVDFNEVNTQALDHDVESEQEWHSAMEYDITHENQTKRDKINE